MRHDSPRRGAITSQSRTWTPERVQVQHWRARHRADVLREFADKAHGLEWTRGLFNALLDELHVTDEFDRLVGPTARVSANQFPRLIATALLVRHSWSPSGLWRIGKRLGLQVAALDAELDNLACGCFRRRRATRPPTSVNSTRPRLTKTNQGA